MTAKQKRIVSVLGIILLILVSIYFAQLFYKQSSSEQSQEDQTKPLTKEEARALLDRLAPSKPSSSPKVSSLSSKEQALLNSMAPAATSKSANTTKSNTSSQYTPQAPPPADIQNLLNSMAPPKK